MLHLPRPLAHGLAQQQFAAGCELGVVDVAGQGTLVGNGELAQLLQLVAEELQAQRMLVGGREHVHDATAHGELSAARHHVDARVGEIDQPHAQVGEVVAATAARQHHGFDRGQVVGEGLEGRAHAGREHELTGRVLLPRGDGPQGGDALAHRFGARAEPLVRQGLPRGEIDDRRRGQVALQRAGERLGLAAGRGDREECARAGIRRQEAGDQRRAEAFDQREIGASGALREGTLERAGARKPRDQSVQSHRTSLRGAGDVAAEARSNVTLDAAARATA